MNRIESNRIIWAIIQPTHCVELFTHCESVSKTIQSWPCLANILVEETKWESIDPKEMDFEKVE